MILFYIIISCFLISLGALIGIFTLSVREKQLNKILLFLVSLSAGALIANFLVALTVVLGGILGYFLSFRAESLIPYLLPFAAAGFIYISASDLMPELRREASLKKSLASFGIFLLGILIMFLLKYISHE